MKSTVLTIAVIGLLVVATAVNASLPSPPNGMQSRFHTHRRASLAGRQKYSVNSRPSTVQGPLHSSWKQPFGASSAKVFNVLDYGAKPDNASDNTAAFMTAIQAAANVSGGMVFAPAGNYRFHGNLNLPPAVVLKGSYDLVPSHDCRQGDFPNDGTVLMPMANRGNASATPFITVQHDAALQGVVIFHPEQGPTGMAVPYPYAVALVGNNAAVTDVEILNAFNGISAVQAHRHYIARIQGQPLNIGVFIDETYDIGRVEDVHFNPWYSIDTTFMYWQTTYGRAFVMGRSDWEYVFNTFAFAYAFGYHFIKTDTGTMNGNLLGIGADYACNASVQVDAAQQPGLLITNGEFTSFHDKSFAPNSTADPAQVVVGPDNTGPVQFVTSSFWGPSNHIARIDGQGTVTFSASVFVQWDLVHKNGSAAIQVEDGQVILQGNDFQMKGTQVELSNKVDKAVIVGNVVAGPENIVDHGAKNVQKGLNAFG